MLAMFKLFDFFSHSHSKPIPKAYIEPTGATRNDAERVVNPLLIKGLYSS